MAKAFDTSESVSIFTESLSESEYDLIGIQLSETDEKDYLEENKIQKRIGTPLMNIRPDIHLRRDLRFKPDEEKLMKVLSLTKFKSKQSLGSNKNSQTIGDSTEILLSTKVPNYVASLKKNSEEITGSTVDILNKVKKLRKYKFGLTPIQKIENLNNSLPIDIHTKNNLMKTMSENTLALKFFGTSSSPSTPGTSSLNDKNSTKDFFSLSKIDPNLKIKEEKLKQIITKYNSRENPLQYKTLLNPNKSLPPPLYTPASFRTPSIKTLFNKDIIREQNNAATPSNVFKTKLVYSIDDDIISESTTDIHLNSNFNVSNVMEISTAYNTMTNTFLNINDINTALLEPVQNSHITNTILNSTINKNVFPIKNQLINNNFDVHITSKNNIHGTNDMILQPNINKNFRKIEQEDDEIELKKMNRKINKTMSTTLNNNDNINNNTDNLDNNTNINIAFNITNNKQNNKNSNTLSSPKKKVTIDSRPRSESDDLSLFVNGENFNNNNNNNNNTFGMEIFLSNTQDLQQETKNNNTNNNNNNNDLNNNSLNNTMKKCIQCLKTAVLWCPQCASSYCGICWGRVAHHTLSEMQLMPKSHINTTLKFLPSGKNNHQHSTTSNTNANTNNNYQDYEHKHHDNNHAENDNNSNNTNNLTDTLNNTTTFVSTQETPNNNDSNDNNNNNNEEDEEDSIEVAYTFEPAKQPLPNYIVRNHRDYPLLPVYLKGNGEVLHFDEHEKTNWDKEKDLRPYSSPKKFNFFMQQMKQKKEEDLKNNTNNKLLDKTSNNNTKKLIRNTIKNSIKKPKTTIMTAINDKKSLLVKKVDFKNKHGDNKNNNNTNDDGAYIPGDSLHDISISNNNSKKNSFFQNIELSEAFSHQLLKQQNNLTKQPQLQLRSIGLSKTQTPSAFTLGLHNMQSSSNSRPNTSSFQPLQKITKEIMPLEILNGTARMNSNTKIHAKGLLKIVTEQKKESNFPVRKLELFNGVPIFTRNNIELEKTKSKD